RWDVHPFDVSRSLNRTHLSTALRPEWFYFGRTAPAFSAPQPRHESHEFFESFQTRPSPELSDVESPRFSGRPEPAIGPIRARHERRWDNVHPPVCDPSRSPDPVSASPLSLRG